MDQVNVVLTSSQTVHSCRSKRVARVAVNAKKYVAILVYRRLGLVDKLFRSRTSFTDNVFFEVVN